DEELVTEAHLELGGMDVDVHRVSREVQEQDERRAVAGRDGRTVPRLRRAQDEGIADGASPHQHVAFASRRLRLRGALREAPHLERALAVADGEQRVGELPPPQLVYAVDGSRRRPDVEERTVVALELDVLPAHPLAVVAHPDQRLAAVLDADADGARARVECVLDQLLHHGRRALHHLAGGDLVGHLRREHGDLRHRGSCGSRTASRSSSQPWMPSGRRTSSQRPSRRSTTSAAPASTVATALAPPYGATRTGVAGLTTTA